MSCTALFVPALLADRAPAATRCASAALLLIVTPVAGVAQAPTPPIVLPQPVVPAAPPVTLPPLPGQYPQPLPTPTPAPLVTPPPARLPTPPTPVPSERPVPPREGTLVRPERLPGAGAPLATPCPPLAAPPLR